MFAVIELHVHRVRFRIIDVAVEPVAAEAPIPVERARRDVRPVVLGAPDRDVDVALRDVDVVELHRR